MLNSETYYIGALKASRYIDPLVASGSSVVRLSELDGGYKIWLDGYRSQIKATYSGRIGIVNTPIKNQIVKEVKWTRGTWEKRLKLPRADTPQFLDIIRQAAQAALFGSTRYSSRMVGYDPDSIGEDYAKLNL